MKECCGEQLKAIFVWDDPNVGYAFNIFACEQCGTVYKQSVWKDESIIKITMDNIISKE